MQTLFKDLTIIDASTVLAGPSVGMFFAELGAHVIKIEHPVNKDVTRSWRLPNEPVESPVGAYFSSVNYGKIYQSLDLMKDRDYAVFLDLCKSADILLFNFKKGDQEKFQLSDKLLQANNPSLIIGKISGFGDDSDRVAYDLILQAESGMMSINGTKESGPLKMPLALIDVLAGHQLKEGILVALLERLKTNMGSIVSVSLFDAAIASLINQASNYLMTGQIPERMGSLHPNIAPYGEIFTTIDGAQITFAIGSNKHFQLLCEQLQLNELTHLQKFDTVQNRVINRMELARLIQAKVKLLDSAELIPKLHKLKVPVAKIRSLDEVLSTEGNQTKILSEKIDGVFTKRQTSIAFQIKNDPLK